MGKWGDNYEKPELVQIAEKLYTSKEELRVFKFDLNSVEFREKYLVKRTERLKERVIIYALLILLCVVLLSFFGYATGKLDRALGGFVAIFAYAMVAVVICLIGLAIKEVQFLYLLVIDKKTIRQQQQEVSQCIETLKEKINIATEKITRLENRRKELLEEQEKTGQEQETDTEQAVEEDGAAFHLRKTGQTEAVDVSQLLEYYEKEDNGKVYAKTLYEQYRTWCQYNGEKPVSQVMLSRELLRLGVEKRKDMYGTFYCLRQYRQEKKMHIA